MNLFDRILHYYIYDMRLKKKLVVSHTILFLIPTAVLIIFLCLNIFRIVIDDTIRSEQVLSSQSVLSAENLVSHVIHASDTLTSSNSARDLFDITNAQAQGLIPSRSKISNLLRLADSLTDHSLIESVKFYYDDRTYHNLEKFNSPDQEVFVPMSRISSPWFLKLENTDTTLQFLPKAALSEKEAQENGSLAYVKKILYRSNETSSNDVAAYAVIYFSETAFEEILQKDSSMKGEYSFLINNDRELLAASSPFVFSSDFVIPAFESDPDASGQFNLVTYNDFSAYTARFPLKNTDWYMVSLIPQTELVWRGRSVIFNFALIYGLIALTALFIAYKLSESIADRIIGVALQMETIRKGRPEPLSLSDAGNDEIGVLSGTYNYMTAEINQLMDYEEKAAKELRNAEFRALQAQINPHFLYNTLDMINWLSQSGQSEKVTEAIQALTRFYRLTLGSKDLISTVQDEVTHVSLYMQLQNMRYNDCAEFIADVPPELGSFSIPRLTFQPIVENALLHGIMMKEEKQGTILLTGWKENDDLVFIISDDGAGIPPEKLDSLLDEKKQAATGSSSRHVGVSNTNLRLKSLYGSKYGLSFTSVPGQGTEVTVRIPALEDEL